jgi:hypothetical protein
MALWLSRLAQSEPNAWADMQNSSSADCSNPRSIWWEIKSPG